MIHFTHDSMVVRWDFVLITRSILGSLNIFTKDSFSSSWYWKPRASAHIVPAIYLRSHYSRWISWQIPRMVWFFYHKITNRNGRIFNTTTWITYHIYSVNCRNFFWCTSFFFCGACLTCTVSMAWSGGICMSCKALCRHLFTWMDR